MRYRIAPMHTRDDLRRYDAPTPYYCIHIWRQWRRRRWLCINTYQPPQPPPPTFINIFKGMDGSGVGIQHPYYCIYFFIYPLLGGDLFFKRGFVFVLLLLNRMEWNIAYVNGEIGKRGGLGSGIGLSLILPLVNILR